MARIPVSINIADPTTGNAVPGVSATIKDRALGTAVTLYALESGGSTVSNPLTTDATGKAFAYADRKGLRIDYSGTLITAYTEYRDIGPSSDGAVDALMMTNAVPLVTSTLPTSPAPVTGQEVYYQNAAMATLGIVWHFRYNSAQATYKWEYVGGSKLRASVITEEVCPSTQTSYGNITTPGPSITAPLSGDYEVFVEARIGNASTTSDNYMSFQSGAAATSDNDAIKFTVNGAYPSAVNARSLVKTLVAAETQVAKYKTSGANVSFSFRTLGIVPIRVI